MQGQICSNCQFGLEEPRGTVFARDRGPGWGTCRRNAPTDRGGDPVTGAHRVLPGGVSPRGRRRLVRGVCDEGRTHGGIPRPRM